MLIYASLANHNWKTLQLVASQQGVNQHAMFTCQQSVCIATQTLCRRLMSKIAVRAACPVVSLSAVVNSNHTCTLGLLDEMCSHQGAGAVVQVQGH